VSSFIGISRGVEGLETTPSVEEVWMFSAKTQSFYLGSLQDLSEIFLRILGRSFSLKINRSHTL